MVPFERNPRFTGREAELAKLERMIFAEDRAGTVKVAITGLSGIGKTGLLIELVHKIEEKDQCLIIWVPATNLEAVEESYLSVVRQLNITGWEQEDVSAKRLLQRYLSSDNAPEWLLVFDNADDNSMVPNHFLLFQTSLFFQCICTRGDISLPS